MNYGCWKICPFAVTFCCTMTVEGNDNYSESATFRIPVSGSYPKLSGDFNAVDFPRLRIKFATRCIWTMFFAGIPRRGMEWILPASIVLWGQRTACQGEHP